MVIRHSERETNRFGNARWADTGDISNAGLYNNGGTPFGFFNGRQISVKSPAPRVCFGGSGTGKLTSVISYLTIMERTSRKPQTNFSQAILDVRGDIFEVSVYQLAASGIFAYIWNPFRQHGQPCHSINPLEHLTSTNPKLFAAIMRLVRALLPLSNSPSGKFFELCGQHVLAALFIDDIRNVGWTSFPRLHSRIHAIEGNIDHWSAILTSMSSSSDLFLQTAAATMMERQLNDTKLFGSIMSEIHANLLWLNDANIRASLEGGDGSLSEMITGAKNGGRPVRFYFNVPGEELEFCAPILRVFFDSIMAIKAEHREAKPILLIIDEAAMLGNFPALKTAVSYGRGNGIITWTFWQDIGQIETNFGRSGVQTFIGSSVLRQFLGTRNVADAAIISQMAGYESLEWDDTQRQQDAEYHMMQQVGALLDGADPFETAQNFSYYEQASRHRSKIKRELISPSEVLDMNTDEMIAFVDVDDLPPIFGEKRPYYQHRPLAGCYLQNPNHGGSSRVMVQGMFREKWLNVREIQTPEKYRHYPQYQLGTALEIENYPL